MAALQYKPQPQWKMGKKIQAAAYNGASMVFIYMQLPIFPQSSISKIIILPSSTNFSLKHGL